MSTRTYIVSENIPYSIKTFLILLMSAFHCKKSVFFLANIALLLKAIVWELCCFLVLFYVFVRQKIFINENLRNIGHKSKIWLRSGSLSTINQNNENFFWHGRIYFVKFSCWCKFNVSAISGATACFFIICYQKELGKQNFA